MLGIPHVQCYSYYASPLQLGIPHVKSYLNGNNLPGVLRLRVLVVKVCTAYVT